MKDSGPVSIRAAITLTRKRGMNHEKLKHGNSSQQQGRQEKGEKDGKTGRTVCPDCGSRIYRLLNSNIPQEAIAKDQGLKYICDDCEEVWA